MNMENILKNRKSVRQFKNRKISNKLLEQILGMISDLNAGLISGNIKFRLYENGGHLYDKLSGKGGYHGVMIESPHYIVVERSNNERDTIINSAYYTEKLITKLVELEIDNCWVSLASVEDYIIQDAFGDKSETIDYVIAIGYGVRSKAFDGIKSSSRKAVEDLVFDKDLDKPYDIEELARRGLKDLFYYSTFAPSTKNRQPWKFIIDGSEVRLLAEYDEWEDSILTDIGIIMYYFKYLANKTGISEKWKFIESNVFIKDGKKYTEIAEFKL